MFLCLLGLLTKCYFSAHQFITYEYYNLRTTGGYDELQKWIFNITGHGKLQRIFDRIEEVGNRKMNT